jgi:hypothetical protein
MWLTSTFVIGRGGVIACRVFGVDSVSVFAIYGALAACAVCVKVAIFSNSPNNNSKFRHQFEKYISVDHHLEPGNLQVFLQYIFNYAFNYLCTYL